MEAMCSIKEYICPGCDNVIETDFDEIDLICGGKNVQCDICESVLWLECIRVCPMCEELLEDKVYFSSENYQEGGKYIPCPSCKQGLWIPVKRKANLPLLLLA